MSTEHGVILKGIGGFYYVDLGGRVVECKAGGRLRKASLSPVAGDVAELELSGDKGFICGLLPRKNLLQRPPVANVDQLFILASAAAPQTDPAWIDKQTVIAQRQGITPVVVLSKSDLCRSTELAGVYRKAGFLVLEISSATGTGIEEARAALVGRVTAFSGNSGVGKSSLLNALLPGTDAEVGAISERISRGRQTTRASELFSLPEGGYVADTPGFSTFDLLRCDTLRKEELEQYFPELASYLGRCRFTGCSHVREPDCAVKAAVASGAVAASRYASYCALYAELSQRKDWE